MSKESAINAHEFLYGKDKTLNTIDYYEEEFEKLKAERDRYKLALEYYADPKNWHSTHGNGGGVDDTINGDCDDGWVAGATARRALTAKDQE